MSIEAVASVLRVSVRLQVTETLALFDSLKTQHRDVAGKSRALHTSCERLVAEKDQLIQFADALRSKLAWFDELERIGAQFHSASLAVDSEDFLPILKRLDDCISYVQSTNKTLHAASIVFRKI